MGGVLVILGPLWAVLALSAAVGAVFGSFFNVCVHRVPRGLSVIRPPSACPNCERLIAPYDNVPVLGWLWLRGKCRNCREPISWRYPLVEFLTAALFVLVAWRVGLRWELLPALYFAGAMWLVTLIDLEARIIPDAITIPGTFLGLAASFLTPVAWWDAALGAVLGFGLFFGIAWGYKRVTGVDGMGGGDIKLAAMLGAFLGWSGLFLTVFFASLAGTLVGVALMVAGRGGRRTALPFGTFLAPAALFVLLWGHDVLGWYAQFMRP